jgi:proteasome lid subunit RPN8/RPN11
VIGSGVVAEGGEALRYAACRNEAASPYRYVIDSQEALRLSIEADDAGQEFWAIVHSHVRSPAVPSPTDVGLAFWPDALYVLVSLAEEEAGPHGEPSCGRRIREGEAFEVTLERTWSGCSPAAWPWSSARSRLEQRAARRSRRRRR